MNEKLNNINFKYKITLFTFVLFLLISAFSPISGDDWKSFVIGSGGIGESINKINILDGRIISGFLINFFSYNKILFDFTFAILISTFVKMCNDVMGTVKTRYLYFYPLIGLLLVSVFTFSYNYTSVTTTVTYTFPTILFFIYYYNLLKSDEIDFKMLIKLILLSILICFSSIHMSIVFLISNLIYYIFRGKKETVKYLILIIIDLILLIVSLSLLEENIFYTNINDIKDNIPYFIENVFSNNIILFILGAIPINMYLYQKLKDNIYNRVVIILFDVILIFSLSYNFFNYSPVNLNLILSKYNGTFAVENWYFIFYYIMYIIMFLISMNYFISNKKVKQVFNIFIISSIVMSILLVVSPIFNKGNIILIILSLIFITCVLAKEMNLKVFVKIVKIVIALLTIYYISMFAVIKYIDYTRNNYIEEQLESGSSNIEVKANPTYYIWRYNPVDYFQIKNFKEYYKIPVNNTIEVKYFGVFETVKNSVKDE